MEKRRIIFVDDEPLVLDGLRRQLRPMRHQWEMAFAAGGPEALEMMDTAPFDVIVTDMRMPGMDGADLLAEVERRHPQVVRIVLSGQVSENAALRLVGPTHQYLSKPCDAETLRSTVTRTCALRDVLSSGELQRLVTQLESLPSLPALYVELQEALESSVVSMREVGEIISRDIGMTAKILQLVNSAFFGVPRHVSSPAEAVTLLGVDTVRALLLSAHAFSHFDGVAAPGFSMEALQSHSLATAACARTIVAAEDLGERERGEATLAALLHDIGRLVLASNLPQAYGGVLTAAAEEQRPLRDVERERLGASHGEVGAYLLGVWGIGTAIVEAVAYHEEPAACAGDGFSTLGTVHVANALAHEAAPASGGFARPTPDEAYLERIGVLDRVSAWREACARRTEAGAAA